MIQRLRIRTLGMGVILLAAACVVALAMWGVGRASERKRQRPSTTETPPEPRLQQDPPQALEQYLRREQARLEGYGWVDRKAGIVHIPVERAMELLLSEGFPVREKPVQPEGGK